MEKAVLAKLKEAKTLEDALALVKKENLPVSEAELRALFATAAGSELSDSDLENVSGGKSVIIQDCWGATDHP